MTPADPPFSEPTYEHFTAPIPATPPEVMTTLSQERLVVGTEWFISGEVRLRRRIVTETRTLKVTLRREELLVEEHDIAVTNKSLRKGFSDEDIPTTQAVAAPTGPPPPVVIVLREEVPEVTVRVQEYERVTAHVVLLENTSQVTGHLRHEEIALDPGSGTETGDAANRH